jgi:hypothetical protein
VFLYKILGENISQNDLIYAESESDAVAAWNARRKSAGIESQKIREVQIIQGPLAKLMKRDRNGNVEFVTILPKDEAEASAVLSSDKSKEFVFWAEPI